MKLALRSILTRFRVAFPVLLVGALLGLPGGFAAAQTRRNPAQEVESSPKENPEASSGGLKLVGPDQVPPGGRVVLRGRLTLSEGAGGKTTFRWRQTDGPPLMVQELVTSPEGQKTVVVPFEFGKCTTSWIAFNPAKAGKYLIEMTATPAGETPRVASKTLLVVEPAPATPTKPRQSNQAPPLVVSIRMSTATVSASSALMLYAFPEGGPSANYTYTWEQQGGPAVSPANGWVSRMLAFNHGAFSAGNTYAFRVTVNSEGVSATATVTVPVQ